MEKIHQGLMAMDIKTYRKVLNDIYKRNSEYIDVFLEAYLTQNVIYKIHLFTATQISCVISNSFRIKKIIISLKKIDGYDVFEI